MRTVVVTGAAGFLGSHLAEYYLKLGYHVIGVDNLLTSSLENIVFLQNQYRNFKFLQRDASEDWGPLSGYLQGALLYVFHFASPASPKMYHQFPFETMTVNTQGLLKGLEFAERNGGRLVFASSSEVYGEAQVNPQAESYYGHVNSFGPRACYNGAKRLGESIVFEFNRLHKGRHGAVRIFNTYGPRMDLKDGRVVINLMVQARKSLPLTIYGDGGQTRSFCYVDDLIRGIHAYAESDISQPLNLGNPMEVQILELATMIKNLFSEKNLSFQFSPLPKDDPIQRKPDIGLAWSKLQWRPEISLTQGLKEMNDWLAQLSSSSHRA